MQVFCSLFLLLFLRLVVSYKINVDTTHCLVRIAALKVRYSLEYSTQRNIWTFSYADALYKTRTVWLTLLRHIEAEYDFVCMFFHITLHYVVVLCSQTKYQ